MTNIVGFRGPTIFHSGVFDNLFKGVDDIFDGHKSTVPYNVEQITNEDDSRVIATQIEVAVAGYNRNGIKLKIINDELQIIVDKVENEKENKSRNYLHKGISQRSFSLKFKLTGIYDKKNIKSTYRDGLLVVNLPVLDEEVIDINID